MAMWLASDKTAGYTHTCVKLTLMFSKQPQRRILENPVPNSLYKATPVVHRTFLINLYHVYLLQAYANSV
jgi:hypothetical protein